MPVAKLRASIFATIPVPDVPAPPARLAAVRLPEPASLPVIRRWMAAFGRDRVAEADPLLAPSDGDPSAGGPPTPEAIAARFLADPDHFVSASVGDRTFQPERSGARGFAIDILVSGLTVASARGGSLYVADDGETTAEIAHYEVGPAFRGLGVGIPAARALFRHFNAHHRVTRVLFVAPVQRQLRVPFKAFVARIGAEPHGHFADDLTAPPLFAWSARRAL